MKSIFNFLSSDLAIDLGTVNTLIYLKENGVVLNEPSVLAIDTSERKMNILAIGNKAKKMVGRTPENIKTVTPMQEGVIADFLAAEEMIKYFIKKSSDSRKLFSPKLIICVPANSTPVERKAILETGLAAGARKVYLIEEPLAAAIGANLPIMEAKGSMIIDIGGGTTEIAIISLGGVVFSKSIKVGGNKFDESIISYLRRNENILIGEVTSEDLKKNIGSGIIPKHGEGKKMRIKGREITEGVPVEKDISERHVAESLAEPLFEIVEAIKIGHSMKGRLRGIRVDTPKSRGGVTPDLVKEIKSRLSNEKLDYLEIIISGGLTPERIRLFVETESPVGTFVVGHYIASGKPKVVSSDIKSIDGKSVGKRGIIPGPSNNERLIQIH